MANSSLSMLDSNTISYYFHGDPQVVPRPKAHSTADVGVPAIVEYELRDDLLRLGGGPGVARWFKV